ncbi:hypothetical protein QZH41_009544 [Actinostola sp. cb2023]|nr:hypothetical protein QZH41_009544 [Actinostola sp. cb2023]
MSSGPSSTSSNEATASDRPTELIALLDSDNAETVQQTKSLIYENLYKSRDPSLLNALVDSYLDTRSTTALQILTNVHEARINNLFDKLNDCLKHHGLRRRIDTFSLLGHIVRKQPSWLYKVVKTPLFETIIKCMKTESDVLLLINAILTITTLLPLIATYVESWLHDFFEIYTRLSAFLNSRPGNIPDVYLLHLHVAVYYYFHRIYAMYPNNFVTFLRGYHHNSRSKQILFQTTIKPMLEHVRLHPCLVTETTQSEVGKHRISLVSSSETDWSHFGGDAPVDEIEILRGQIQLLHHQLLYERHKCDQHATRNRRLIGKTFKAVQYQEELLAIKDHLKLQEEKMRELNQALIIQTEDNRKFKEITSAWDNQQQTQLRNLLNENAQLQHDKKCLKEALQTQRKDYNTLNMQLDHAQSKVFFLEQELEHVKPKLDEKDHLRSELDRLTREVLIMGELHQHHKDLLEKASCQTGKNPEANLQLYSCQKELSASKQNARKQKAEVEATHSKIVDLEMSLSKKEMEVKELKKFTESLNGTYISKLKVMEEKYDAQKKINQSIESHILNLQLALADSKHQSINIQKTRTATRSTSPMQQISNLRVEGPSPGSFSTSA